MRNNCVFLRFHTHTPKLYAHTHTHLHKILHHTHRTPLHTHMILHTMILPYTQTKQNCASYPSYTSTYSYYSTYEDTYAPACHPHQKILFIQETSTTNILTPDTFNTLIKCHIRNTSWNLTIQYGPCYPCSHWYEIQLL